jgi:hypothetical protein
MKYWHQRIDHWSDSAATDECHYKVDSIRRWDLSHNLVTYAGLAGCIGQ